MPARCRASPSSAPRPRRCESSATRSRRAISRSPPACRSCRRPIPCPTIPSLEGSRQDDRLPGDAEGVSWGGGGRGMRVIRDETALIRDVTEAKREAKAAFGKDEVYLEKLVERARHIEVQLLGDTHGNLVHLFERDCSSSAATRRWWSARRRRILGQEQREELCGYALRIADAANYVCAGTVEFLLDADHRQILLHRGQSAHPGRAHRHRGGDRHRYRQGADPHDRGEAHRRAGIGRAAAGGDPAQRPRAAVPHHHRGPGREFHPRLRPHHRLSRRDRLRRPARRRHRLFRRGHHPVLRSAARKGHRLGALAGGGDRAHGSRPARIPHPRRRDQPGLPRERHHASGLPQQPLHDALHRRDARADRRGQAARPRDQAPDLHRRRHRQRPPRRRAAGRSPPTRAGRCRAASTAARPTGARQRARP